MQKEIDLDKARTSPLSRVLSGRDRGERVRNEFRLDDLDNGQVSVLVRVPDDLYSMNLSFFLGLFGPSVRKFGKDHFLEKYHFRAKPVHMSGIMDGISRALREKSILNEERSA